MTGERRERIVIVGGGVAGLRAAERVRELDFDGELIIVSEEPYRPYHRPALSKQLLTGVLRPKDIVLPVHTELDAVWRYATRAVRLEPEEHILHLPGEEEIEYDGLVIATGVGARHLPGAPRQDPRVHVLRNLADAVAIQRTIAHGRGGVALIGGGFVSSEVASAARELGRDTTIIIRDLALLTNVPGAEFGETITDLHRSRGVQIVTQAKVRHWVPQRDGIALHLSNGQVVVAGTVVLGVGGVPAVNWLRGSGLILDDGVMCDPTCHAIGAEDVVVAGDVARWPNLRFDSMPRRVEHWINASEMGRAAAENLLVGRAAAKPFTPVPRFWTDLHGMRIQAAGLPALAQDTVPLAGSVKVGSRIDGYVSGGSLVGVVAWDSPHGMLRWTAELEKQSDKTMRVRKLVRPPARPAPRQPVLRRPDQHSGELYVPDFSSYSAPPVQEPALHWPTRSEPPAPPPSGPATEPVSSEPARHEPAMQSLAMRASDPSPAKPAVPESARHEPAMQSLAIQVPNPPRPDPPRYEPAMHSAAMRPSDPGIRVPDPPRYEPAMHSAAMRPSDPGIRVPDPPRAAPPRYEPAMQSQAVRVSEPVRYEPATHSGDLYVSQPNRPARALPDQGMRVPDLELTELTTEIRVIAIHAWT